MSQAIPHPQLALSLASSHLGFHVHAGFLDALVNEAGVRPGHIGAASSGAYVGGLYAAGFTPTRIHELMKAPAMKRSFWEWRGPLRGFSMMANLRGSTGLLSGRRVLSYLHEHLGDRCIEECQMARLSLAVTNLTSKRSEIIRQGPLAQAIVASCAVPALFKAFPLGESLHWDGAVSDSSPFHHFLDDPSVSTILVHVIKHTDLRRPRGNGLTIAEAFGRAHQIVTDRLLQLGIECGTLRGKRMLVLTSEVPRYRFAQKGTAEPLFEAGRQTVLERLEKIRALVCAAPV